MAGAPDPRAKRLAFLGNDGRVIGDTTASVPAPGTDGEHLTAQGGEWRSLPLGAVEAASISFDSGANTLSHYSEADENLTWSGMFVTNPSAVVRLSRIGRTVVCGLTALTGLGDSISSGPISSTPISAPFRPAAPEVPTGVMLFNPGTGTITAVRWVVDSTGVITVTADASGANLPPTAGVIGFEPQVLSWTV